MSRARKFPITDIVLTEEEVRKVRKGYHIFRVINKHKYCVFMENNPAMKKLARLRKQIKMLRRELKKG